MPSARSRSAGWKVFLRRGPRREPARLPTVPSPTEAILSDVRGLSYAGGVAGDVDTVASAALRELTGIPGVRRAGIALSEGGGRRLRFRSSDGRRWCHIDAYDDVPLTAVVRTGGPLLGALDDLRTRV